MGNTKLTSTFIGREIELEEIYTILNSARPRHVLFLGGTGGVGKTRLLLEIENRISNSATNHYKLLPIIDFDDDKYKLSQGIGFAIAQQFPRGTFDKYVEAHYDLRMAEDRTLNQESSYLQRKQIALRRAFVDCFNLASENQKVVLRFDTTDSIHEVPLSFILDVATDLRNVVLIAAGRNAEALYDRFQQQFGPDVSKIQLEPFTLEQCDLYLREAILQYQVALDVEWMRKVFLLSGGLPVVLDLAIEWSARNRKLEAIDDISLDGLMQLKQQKELGDPRASSILEAYTSQLRSAVVSPIGSLETDYDYLLFLLAKVYPLDRAGISEMLNCTLDRAGILYRAAANSSAIKVLPDDRIKLHDVVHEWVNIYVWPKIDIDGKWEASDSTRAIEYLTKQSANVLQDISRLRHQEAQDEIKNDPHLLFETFNERRELEHGYWVLRLERLRRQLALDVVSGFPSFLKEYEFATTGVSNSSARNGLIEYIFPYADLSSPRADIHNRQLSFQDRLEINRLYARELTYSGNYTQAAQLYEKLLQHLNHDSEEYVETLIGWVNQLVRAGKLAEALRANQEAGTIARKLENRRLQTEIVIDSGWICRLQGQLDEALSYYMSASVLAEDLNDEKSLAKVFQSQAYIYALQHRERDAIERIQAAIRMWRRLIEKGESNEFRLGQAFNVAGEIFIESDRPQNALPYFELSWQIFEVEESTNASSDASEWKSKSRSGLGFAHWQMALASIRDNLDPRELLSDALDELNWASEFATAFDSPTILNRLGEVYFLKGDYEMAGQMFFRSMEEAKSVGDAFTELHSLGDLARVAFFKAQPGYSTPDEFRNRKTDHMMRFGDSYFEVLEGLFYSYIGHLALRQEDIESALDLYLRGLPLLVRNNTYGSFNLQGQLEFIGEMLIGKLPGRKAEEFILRLRQEWLNNDFGGIASLYFRDWYDFIDSASGNEVDRE